MPLFERRTVVIFDSKKQGEGYRIGTGPKAGIRTQVELGSD